VLAAMRWKAVWKWGLCLLSLGWVGLVAASECLYRATLARVPVLPRPAEHTPLPPLYVRMRWTSLERTTTRQMEPVWLGTFVGAWARIALLKHRPEDVSARGLRLADRVSRQWWGHLDETDHPPPRTPERFALLVWLTRNWSAEDLLAFDAEHAYLVHRLVGMQAGARTLLGRDWAHLDAAGMALLLAVNEAPGGRRDPWCSPDRIRAKRDWILKRLSEAGTFSPEEADVALRAPLGLATRPADWEPCPAQEEQTLQRGQTPVAQ
jgi:hypothetical protein